MRSDHLDVLVRINGAKATIADADDLWTVLTELPKESFHQVCLQRTSGEVLCAQIHAGRGWLMYLLYAGDPGFSSRNSAYNGPPNAKHPFRLPNGQLDEYPAEYWLTCGSVYRAMQYFYVHGGLAPWVSWHDDALH
jgi:hypothetical protein